MKHYLLKTCLAMLCLVLGIGSAWAEEVTLTTSDYQWTLANQTTSQTVDGVTFSFSKGSTNPTYYATNGLRTYEGCSITISSSVNISKIVFTYTNSNNGCLKNATVGSWNESTKTWTGSAKSIGLTVGHSSGTSNGQVRITEIVVTTESAAKKDAKLFSESSYSIAPGADGNISEFVNVPSDYDGTIYYGSNDEDVFIIDGKGDYLAGDGGSTTIYASAAATSKYNEIYEEVTINVEKQKAEPGISFATPSYTFTCFDVDKTTQSLSNPNDLAVVYESSNTNVATVDENGVVTVKDYAGDATITATFEGNEEYKAGSASFDITVNRAETGYAFSESSVDVTIGESFDLPTISASNANADLTLAFTSSNTNVASITSTSKNTYSLTIKGTGSTTIKATWQQTTRFERGEATYTLTVTDANAGDAKSGYELVTATNDLEDGVDYIIVCEELGYAMGTVANKSGSAVSVSITDHFITDCGAALQMTMTANNDNTFTFKTGTNTNLNNSSGADLTNGGSSATGTSWTISFSNGNVVMKSTARTSNQMQVSTNGANPIFKSYASSNAGETGYYPVQLYKKTEGSNAKVYGQFTISDYFTDGEGNYYGTFYSENAWEVPAGVEAQAVGVTDDKLTISTLNDNDNNVVAAGTAVLLKATAPGTYVYAESEEDGVSNANNLLNGSSVAVTAESMATAHPNCIYYRMTKHNGTTLGFWWGAEDGAAFALAANKAYLAVPTQQASNLLGFRFGEDTLTTIKEAEIENNGSAIYNLQGQRINRLQQGVNIVNGRKVIR